MMKRRVGRLAGVLAFALTAWGCDPGGEDGSDTQGEAEAGEAESSGDVEAGCDADILAFEKEMDAAKADWQFVDFSGAVHCFAEPGSGNDPASNCRYDERAAKRAYTMLHAFFRERFAAN